MSRLFTWPLTRWVKNTLWFFFFTIFFSPVVVLAQNPPAPALDENLQKFLNVPIWYLNFRIEFSANGSGGNADGGSWNSSIERVATGTQVLGMRSQGPSLTMPELATQFTSSPERMDEIMAHYVNWLPGNTIDENKTDEENDAEFNRLWEANKKAMASLHYSYWSSGTYGPNRGQAGGTGEAMISGNIQLEFDAEKKKYNFLFAPGIFDTPATAFAVRGEAVINEGSDSERRDPIERGFSGGDSEQIVSMDPPFASGPLGANIVGDLPASFGPISGVSRHNVKVNFRGEISGTYVITYTLSPNPPTPVELLIIPPREYYDWRPLGGANEIEAGDFIEIKVKLQKAGGGDPQFKATKITYRLKDTSREKGVSMNSPLNPDPTNPFDLQIEDFMNLDLTVKDDTWQEASITGTDMTEGKVNISSLDYGAYGDLEVEAELSNREIIKGVIVGTSDEKLKLPYRKGNSHIADVFVRNLGSLADKDDNENDPVGDGYKGDGISLYEEYRGFMNGENWVTGDSKKKDVFVLNQMRGLNQVQRGITYFERATKLKVHRDLKDDQVNGDMVINFNFNPETHLAEDQHVIRIKAAATVASGNATAFVEKVGTPGTAKSVNVPPDLMVFRDSGGRTSEYFAVTLAHEMLHDCNVFHHGETDTTVGWELDTNPIPDEIIEQNVRFNSTTRQYDPTGPRRVIKVRNENDDSISPDEIFGAGQTKKLVYLGLKNGLHSGHAECLMRYDIAMGYPSITEGNVRYLSWGEASGAEFCNTRNGTGVNDPNRNPQSRYGPAAIANTAGATADRGDCQHQLRVNDIGQEPDR